MATKPSHSGGFLCYNGSFLKNERIVLTITVYTKQDCVQCKATKRWMDSKGVRYNEVDILNDDAAMARIKNAGFLAAPVVETSTGKMFSGFNPKELDNLFNN